MVLTFFIKCLRVGLIILQLVPYECLNQKFYNIKVKISFLDMGIKELTCFLLSNFVIELY